jgi:molybdate transport system substrate-binding protein
MRYLRCCAVFILSCFCQTTTAWAEDGLIIAAGAGYKRLVEQTCAAFPAQSGIQVQQVFGNMGQLVPQVKESDKFDFILGDKSHLDSTDLAFSGERVIGKGKLVAATPKESKITSLDELTGEAVTRIAIADSKKAIYGHAATEYLTRKGLWEQVQP